MAGVRLGASPSGTLKVACKDCNGHQEGAALVPKPVVEVELWAQMNGMRP